MEPSTQTTPSLEDLIQQAHLRGWKVNNIIELDNGMWLVSLRDGHLGYDFGRHSCLVTAFLMALSPTTSSPLLEANVKWRKEAALKPQLKLSDLF